MPVQQTSILAYHQLDDLSTRKKQVFTVIAECQPVTNLEISQRLDLPINSITPRTYELVKMGLVESTKTTLINYSNKSVRVMMWETTKEGSKCYGL